MKETQLGRTQSSPNSGLVEEPVVLKQPQYNAERNTDGEQGVYVDGVSEREEESVHLIPSTAAHEAHEHTLIVELTQLERSVRLRAIVTRAFSASTRDLLRWAFHSWKEVSTSSVLAQYYLSTTSLLPL